MIAKPVEQLVIGDMLPYSPEHEPWYQFHSPHAANMNRFVSVIPVGSVCYAVTAVKVDGDCVRWEIVYRGRGVQAEAPVGTVIGVYPEEADANQASKVPEAW